MVDQLVQRRTPFKPEPIIISELKVNAVIRGWLLAVDVQIRTDKNGKPFRQLKLRDQRGNEIKVNQFDLRRAEALVPQKGRVVLLEGAVEEYRNETQIKLIRAELDETAPPD